jgi:hypothetical protein
MSQFRVQSGILSFLFHGLNVRLSALMMRTTALPSRYRRHAATEMAIDVVEDKHLPAVDNSLIQQPRKAKHGLVAMWRCS